MARLQCEMFGCLVYPESLSYQELLDMEEEVLSDLNAAFQECEAQFRDFFQDGDFLRMSCAFPLVDEEKNRDFARKIQDCLRPELTANLMFLDKNLDRISLYSMDRESMREQTITLPDAGEGLSGRLAQVYARRLTPAGWIAEGALPGARRELRPVRLPHTGTGGESAKKPQPQADDFQGMQSQNAPKKSKRKK